MKSVILANNLKMMILGRIMIMNMVLCCRRAIEITLFCEFIVVFLLMRMLGTISVLLAVTSCHRKLRIKVFPPQIFILSSLHFPKNIPYSGSCSNPYRCYVAKMFQFPVASRLLYPYGFIYQSVYNVLRRSPTSHLHLSRSLHWWFSSFLSLMSLSI